MSYNNSIPGVFERLGGVFLTPPARIAALMPGIKAFVFDWDGVFNAGMKSIESGSPFFEQDSMGINMLRFHYWLRSRRMPGMYIVSGASNPSARAFAEREHFDGVLLNCRNKQAAFADIARQAGMEVSELAFVFDDIIDLAAAESCGLRFLVSRGASPLLTDFVTRRSLADYITAHPGGQYAVREICEMLLGLQGAYDETIALRMAHGELYQTYLAERNEKVLQVVSA